MISEYLKDRILTTQSSTKIIDLKPKMKKNKNIFYEKRMCFVLLVSRNTIVELFSKERAFPAWCCTKQTKIDGNYFLKWASIAVISICLWIARARPAKILRAITFLKNDLEFNPHQSVTHACFNLHLVLRMSESRPVLFCSGVL